MTTNRRQGTSSLALILITLVMNLAGCSGQRLVALPPQLVGEWRTADARYQGRSMNLSPDHVNFGMGGITPDRLEHVETVRTVDIDNGKEYRIALRTPEAAEDTLILDLTEGTLHLESQPSIIWTKVKVPAGLPATAPRMPQAHQNPSASVPLFMNDHKIIYRIDCVHPNVCKSY